MQATNTAPVEEQVEKSLTFAETERVLAAIVMDTIDGIESGDVSPDDEEIRLAVEAAIRASAEKRDKMAGVVFWFETVIEGVKRSKLDLDARLKRYTNKRAALLGYIQSVMEEMGVEKLDGITSTMALRKLPPSVEVINADLIPGAYVRTSISLDADDLVDCIRDLLAQAKRGEVEEFTVADLIDTLDGAGIKATVEKTPQKSMILDALKANEAIVAEMTKQGRDVPPEMREAVPGCAISRGKKVTVKR